MGTITFDEWVESVVTNGGGSVDGKSIVKFTANIPLIYVC